MKTETLVDGQKILVSQDKFRTYGLGDNKYALVLTEEMIKAIREEKK